VLAITRRLASGFRLIFGPIAADIETNEAFA